MKTAIVIFLIGLALIFLGGCGNCSYESRKAAESELDSIDYEIISSALGIFLGPHDDGYYTYNPSAETREYYGNPNMDLILITDSTNVKYISPAGLGEHKWADSTDSYMTERLKYENRRKHHVDNTKITGYKTALLTGEDAEEFESLIFSGFKYLYKKYPDAWGVVTFSKPSYDLDKNEAVIYVQFMKHYLWGEGVYIWLKKSGGKWYLYDRLQLWVS